MEIDEKISARLWELIRIGDEILMTAQTITSTQEGDFSFVMRQEMPPKTIQRKKIDNLKAIQWKTSCLQFLENNFGNSHYLTNFSDATKYLNFETVRNGIGVLNAAKEDYDKGFLIENSFVVAQKEEINLAEICDKEAERNTRIYLIVISIFVVLLALSLSNFGLLFASISTSGILVVGYILSIIFLKEWTLSKLHERVLELEKIRIYKRFHIEND